MNIARVVISSLVCLGFLGGCATSSEERTDGVAHSCEHMSHEYVEMLNAAVANHRLASNYLATPGKEDPVSVGVRHIDVVDSVNDGCLSQEIETFLKTFKPAFGKIVQPIRDLLQKGVRHAEEGDKLKQIETMLELVEQHETMENLSLVMVGDLTGNESTAAVAVAKSMTSLIEGIGKKGAYLSIDEEAKRIRLLPVARKTRTIDAQSREAVAAIFGESAPLDNVQINVIRGALPGGLEGVTVGKSIFVVSEEHSASFSSLSEDAGESEVVEAFRRSVATHETAHYVEHSLFSPFRRNKQVYEKIYDLLDAPWTASPRHVSEFLAIAAEAQHGWVGLAIIGARIASKDPDRDDEEELKDPYFLGEDYFLTLLDTHAIAIRDRRISNFSSHMRKIDDLNERVDSLHQFLDGVREDPSVSNRLREAIASGYLDKAKQIVRLKQGN